MVAVGPCTNGPMQFAFIVRTWRPAGHVVPADLVLVLIFFRAVRETLNLVYPRREFAHPKESETPCSSLQVKEFDFAMRPVYSNDILTYKYRSQDVVMAVFGFKICFSLGMPCCIVKL